MEGEKKFRNGVSLAWSCLDPIFFFESFVFI